MYRERLTITLESELVKAIDVLIDKEQLRNRSQTIEHLLKEGLGLHQLQQAFLFFESSWNQAYLENVLSLLTKSGIDHLYLCASREAATSASDIQVIINSHSPQFSTELVPADFGSGGSLMMQKPHLEHPFLLIWIESNQALPDSLIAPYLFHRQHHGTLTHLLYSQGPNFVSCGITIADPELLESIPAGITSLQATVFPLLEKGNKTKAYLFAP